MRIYTNTAEMLSETERELFEMGHRYQSYSVQDQVVKDNKDFATLELMHYGYQLVGWNDIMDGLKTMGISEEWAVAEFHERIDLNNANKNPGQAYHKRDALWDAYLHDGLFSYTYAERWTEQIPYILRELRLHPNSRQVMMTMYDRHQDMMNWAGKARIPCSVSYQFMIRNGRLNLLYNQRSCDYKKFFMADVYFTVMLLEFVADQVGVKPGMFTHMIGSLHAFRKDLPAVIF